MGLYNKFKSVQVACLAWAGDKVSRPAGAVVLALMLSVAGVTGSVYSSEIGQSMPLMWVVEFDEWSLPSTVFWFFAITSSYLFGGVALIDAKNRGVLNDQINRIMNQNIHMETVLSTQMPRHFMGRFSYYAVASTEQLFRDGAVVEGDEMKEAVRRCLGYIAEIASWHDCRMVDSPVYSANLMLFRGVDSLTKDEWLLVRENVMFVGAGRVVQRDSVYGVLFVVDGCAVVGVDKETLGKPSSDESFARLFLYVPREGTLEILHGAPELLCGVVSRLGGNLDVCDDGYGFDLEKASERDGDSDKVLFEIPAESSYVGGMDGLRHSLKSVGCSSEVEKAVLDYFRKMSIGSCVSMLLICEGRLLGIINVHADREGILNNGESLEQFVVATAMLRAQIAHVILKAARNEKIPINGHDFNQARSENGSVAR